MRTVKRGSHNGPRFLHFTRLHAACGTDARHRISGAAQAPKNNHCGDHQDDSGAGQLHTANVRRISRAVNVQFVTDGVRSSNRAEVTDLIALIKPLWFPRPATSELRR